MNILILDDEEHILEHLSEELEYESFTVHKTKYFQEAIKIINNEQIDIAIIDLYITGDLSKYGAVEFLHYCNNNMIKSRNYIISGSNFDDIKEYVIKDSIRLKYGKEELNKIIDEIESNFIYKGGKSYISVLKEKLGLTDNNNNWFGEYFALLIGVENYKDSHIKNLRYPFKDIDNLKNVLIELYLFNENRIKTLINSTRKNIIDELYKISKKLNNNDNLLIFFAGHGMIEERRQQGYWLPSDAEMNSPSNWISNSDIQDFIRSIKSKHTLVISDCCFSGSILLPPLRGIPSTTIQEKYRLESRSAICSGGVNQLVSDRSKFIDYLIMSLKINKSKFFYAQKLYTNIYDYFLNDKKIKQNPVYGKIQNVGDNIGGDFIFVKR